MIPTDVESKREELRKLYFEAAQLNRRKKELEEQLLKRERTTGKRERLARKRKDDSNLLLSITATALLTAFSRDKVYRLLKSGVLRDCHPVSVGDLIRSGAGFRGQPRRHLEAYEVWRTNRNKNKEMAAPKEDLPRGGSSRQDDFSSESVVV